MVDYTKLKQELIGLLIFIFLVISLIQFIPLSYAQTNGESISFSSNLGFNEYSEIEGTKENTSIVKIELPEANWTVTDIQINFSDISLGSEIKTIENSETALDLVENKNPSFRTFALGTQLEILEATEIFGVYIKGYKTPQATETIQFQIQGYDEGNQSPNNTIYRSIDLNISLTLDWYYQDFSSEAITLPIGNYSLVMNGTNLPVDTEAKYYWAMDDSDPQIPYLHTSSYITSWTTGAINTSFLVRLNQKVARSYFPLELNMSAEIDGDIYEVINGSTIGKGSLEIANLDYFFEETNLSIQIKINRSLILNFNYNYSIKLRNDFVTVSSAKIEESYNLWSMSPLISRVSQYYYVQFNFPNNWYNFTIYQKVSSSWENLTSLVNIDMINKTITIPNSTIEDGTEWEIEANSPNINLNIQMTNTDWKRGDELEFSVESPINQGNLTFIVIKPSGKPELIKIEESVSGLIFFSFEIPSNWTEGSYSANIYWNNQTDIGMKSQEFQIFIPPIPFTLEPWMIFTIIFGIAGISLASAISYRALKKLRIKQIERKQKLYNSCIDILNLDYIMVTDKKSGLNVYTQNFTEKEIDAALISGFLQAIHSFGIELIKVEDQSQTIKLEYKDSIVLMSEFVNIRLILIMKESPSRFFLYAIEELAYDIYRNYGDLIDSFNGDVKPFHSIENLLKQHLNVSFIYPLRITKIEKLEKVRITQNERSFINKAVTLMKTNNRDYFLIKSLLPGKECSPRDVEIVISLMEKKVFQLP
ncbi:MAG: hypothetical protein ACFFBE_08060 [Promethearchaeota archaeon]